MSSVETGHSLDMSLNEEFSVGIWTRYSPLLILALAVDLLTPYLIWQGWMPASVRWLSDMAVALMLVVVCFRMLAFDHLPRAVLVILGVSLIGITVASFEGQNATATAWGWWRMFKYPLVGIFVYLQPQWPEKLGKRLGKFLIIILGLNLLFQIAQYLSGQPAGDDLAGTFGRRGVGPLMFFVVFVVCLALGQWIVNEDWKILLFVLICGIGASVLSEIKIFPFVLLILGVLTLAIYMIRGGQFRKFAQYLLLLCLIIFVFVSAYNKVVADTRGTRRFEEYLNLTTSETYLNNVHRGEYGQYSLGRSFALKYGWNVIQRDAATFLFGTGLGSRGTSKSLGITGRSLEQGFYGSASGTSMLVMMQEMGVVGLAVFGGIVVWIANTLVKDIKRNPGSDDVALRFGLLLFTLCWPLWLYYHRVWDFSVAMILYWGTMGYVFSKSHKPYRATRRGSTEHTGRRSSLLSGNVPTR